MVDLVQVHKLLECEASLLLIIGEATQLKLKLIICVSDVLQTDKGFLEEKERIVPVLDLGRHFVMHPKCSLPKDMMHNIPQKIHVDGKVLVERSILGLLRVGTCSSQCDNRWIINHFLILGGIVCLVIFIVKRNKELSHTICQEDPRWATNIAQQSHDVLKSLGNIA